MSKVSPVPVPSGTTLAGYIGGAHYTDCFAATVPGEYTLGDFVTCFYQTPLFRLEAALLALFARRPSTNAQAAELGRGERDTFAAWTVEARDGSALLMCDMAGRTRSWFSVMAGQGETTLLFGSVVTARKDGKIGALFHLLLPFHKCYARALLWSAARRIV